MIQLQIPTNFKEAYSALSATYAMTPLSQLLAFSTTLSLLVAYALVGPEADKKKKEKKHMREPQWW